MTNDKLIENLVNLSKKKKELMIEILNITKKQRKFMELDKIEIMAKQIELKEKIIGDVDKLDLMFYKLINQLKSNLGIDALDEIDAQKYPQIRELKKVVGDILNIASETKTVDDENNLKIQGDGGRLSNKFKGLKQGKRVSNAYKAQKNILVDKKK